MKRKFFSMMVAACAAVLSFSGLTGCSSGNEEEDNSAGYVTYRQWESARKGFQLSVGSLTVFISPTEGDADTGFDQADKWATPISKWCMLSFGPGDREVEETNPVLVSYEISEYLPGENPESPDALPYQATLELTFTDSHQLTNSEIKAAFGLGVDDESEFRGTVKVTLRYTSPGNGGTAGATYWSSVNGGSLTANNFAGNFKVRLNY